MHPLHRIRAIALLCVLVAAARAADRGATDDFERHVRPLLAQECYACHSQQAPVLQAGLRIDSLEGMLRGGQRGAAIVPGDPRASLLLQALRYDGEVRMPPSGKLPDTAIARVEAWVRSGAPYPEPTEGAAPSAAKGTAHWALIQPAAVDPPPSGTGWAETAIDRFVEARLAAAGLDPSPEASARTLLRRVYYDLTGLPPSADEVDSFAAASAPDAYGRVVERLLASREFGQRWARHWLDVARYADEGFAAHPFPMSWTYRDWVVDALNEDLPYDRFVTYQLAADLVGAERRHLPALGLLALGINLPRAIELPQNIDDRIDVVTRGLLGLSVACARCHDHKFDRITQADYYGLYGVFLNSPDALEPVPLEEPGWKADADFFRDKLAMRREWLDRYRRERLADHVREFRRPEVLARYLEVAWQARGASNSRMEALSKERNVNLYMLHRWRRYLEGLVGPAVDVFRALDAPGGAIELAGRMAAAEGLYRWPDPEQEVLRLAMRGNGSPTDVPLEDFWWVQNEGDGNVMKALKWQYEAVLNEWGHRGGPRHASVVADAKSLQPSFVFVRGNQHDKGREVPRRFLSALSEGTAFRSGSGRLELARAIASPDNPLTARVLVNRVWAGLFGEGLVRTPSDFGLRGDRPSHPELLDHLAAEFMASGWSIKRLVRRIALSRTYRQSSGASGAGTEIDPANQLLWRQSRVRLDFEALRDSMLAASGRLDSETDGPPFDIHAVPSSPRRTLYAYVSREKPSQLMRSFDFSNPEEHAPRRQLTTVPQQALFLMNSPFLAEQARAVASGCGSTRDCVKRVHRAVLGRLPDPQELERAMEFVGAGAEAPPPPAQPAERTAWLNGVARIDAETGAVSGFRPMGYRVGDRLQPDSMLPALGTGRASLTPSGGFPGDGPDSAVVRRWRAPEAMKVSIAGELSHSMNDQALRFDYSNGVRGWIVCGRRGALASWTVRGYSVDTSVRGLEVAEGDHLDFVVDSLGDYESDSFRWAPRIEESRPAGGGTLPTAARVWRAEDGFEVSAEHPLRALEQYAQVLLMTNEFAFRD